MTHNRSDTDSAAVSVHRKFSIADAMILTAGAAGAIWLYRELQLRFDLLFLIQFNENYSSLITIRSWAFIPLPFLAMLTPCTLSLFLRSPRPARPELTQSLGFIGCLVGTIFLCFGICQIALMYSFEGWTDTYNFREWTYNIFLVNLGFCVFSSWVPMILNRRQPTLFGRLEWLGRVVGLGWILMTVCIYGIDALMAIFL
jgi:hypothetical protein